MGTIKATTLQHESASSGIDMDASGNATLTGNISAADVTASGDLTVDTDTLKVDATNDRVGINKASPTVALDVTGAITASGTVTANSFSGDGSALTGIVTQTSGTWTPTHNYAGSSITVTVDTGKYRKIGDIVFIWFSWSHDNAIDNGASYGVEFGGLPYTPAAEFDDQMIQFSGWPYESDSAWFIKDGKIKAGNPGSGALSYGSMTWRNIDYTARTYHVNGWYYTDA